MQTSKVFSQTPTTVCTRTSYRWVPITLCLILLAVFAISSLMAARTKCATFDEPLHSVAGFVLTHDGDYRLNPEDPPLWQRFANLLEPSNALAVNLNDQRFHTVLMSTVNRYDWLTSTLYPNPRPPGHDADAFLMRQRIMLVLLGVVLGGLISLWTGKVAGPVAAVAATFFFALDPNFLANASIVKNDVAITLLGFALAFVTWRLGRCFSYRSAAAIVLLCSAAIVTKFSWPMVVGACFLLLLIRALLPWTWARSNSIAIKTRWGRLAAVVLLGFITSVVGFVTIWENYSFRFAPSPDQAEWTFRPLLLETEMKLFAAQRLDREPTREEVRSWQLPLVVRAAMQCEEHQLLPQTYIYGFIYTYQSALMRSHILLGETKVLGNWYYFSLAFLFKTPMATLAAVVLALAVVVIAIAKASQGHRLDGNSWQKAWTLLSLIIPPIVFAILAMSSNLNIGFRHFLPVMPFVFLGIGAACASIFVHWGRNGRVLLVGLAIGLVTETVIRFPDYIAFFNSACGGPMGGLGLLGDSNLDWGQDLPLLAKWQRQNPKEKLYLSYFGTADPVYYGIDGDSIAGDYSPKNKHPVRPTTPGVVAISATNLQGVYISPEEHAQLKAIVKDQKLIDILGGTIYLYQFIPSPAK